MKRLRILSISLVAAFAGLALAQGPGGRTGKPNERPAQAAMPAHATGDGGLEGIYAGTEQRQAFSAFTRRLETQWIDWIYYFSPDGSYMRGTPNPANDPPDWAREVAKLKPYEYGRYSFRGSQLALRPASGFVETPYSAKLEGGRLNLGAYQLWRVPPARDATFLQGKWHGGGSFLVGDGSGPTGTAATSALWEFRQGSRGPNEGTYTARTGGGSSFGGGGAGQHSGTWQFRPSRFGGGWLVLRERNTSVSVLSWPNAPDVLYIDNHKFNRLK